MSNAIDLTQGETAPVLIRFTLPLFLSVFFQQFYNIADSAIAGSYVGEDALAAIGASYPITMLFMAVAVGCQIGCSVVLGRLYGSKSYQRVRSCITTSLLSGLVISLVLTGFGILFCADMMRLVKTPDNIFADGCTYLRIYTIGFPFVYIYNVLTGLFSSLGDSKTPLYLLIISSIGNVVLDLAFVLICDWGIAGLAWATLLMQAIACILGVIALLRRMRELLAAKHTPLFSRRDFIDVMGVSIPSILQQSCVSVGNLFIQTFVNPFGSSVIAGYSAAIKLNTFALTCFSNIGSGVSNFTAQNLGAAKPKRVKEGFRIGVVMACVVAAIFSLCYLVFGKQLLGLFLDENSSALALETGMTFQRYTAPFYCIICIKLIADAVLRGSGSMVHFIICTLLDLVMRVVLAAIFKGPYGASGIWMAWPVSWLAGTALSYLFYHSNVWQRHLAPPDQPVESHE